MKSIFLSPADLQNPLTLEPEEDTVYFLPQETGTTSLNLCLSLPHVRAIVVGLFRATAKQHITLEQKHSAHQTESHILLKTLVAPTGAFSYQGNIAIGREAVGSNASQEIRGLIQGEGAQFKVIPGLEIFPKDVTCTHKASSAPINVNSLFTLQTKGFSEADAKILLENAFLKSAFDTLAAWGVPKEALLQAEEQFFEKE